MDTKLTTLLKEVLITFNKEARLVPAKMESEMCIALDRLGGEWLLLGLEAQGIDGARDMRQNPDLFLGILKDELGYNRMLKASIGERGAAILKMRRKVVSTIRAFRPEHQGIKFSIETFSGNGGIYELLSSWDKDKGGVTKWE